MAQNKKALIIATSYGVESDEIVRPKDFLETCDVEVTVATPGRSVIQTLVMDKDPGATVEPDAVLADMTERDFDLLVVPGGTINADTLRLDEDAVRLAREFASAGKPIAAICHAPWLLVESGLAVGKTLTSFPSVRTDVINAGGTWVDEPVVVDETNGFVLITSRTPDDMDAFTGALRERAW